jgi:hypothetical protein
MINDKDGHIPSPLIMFTCTALHHALLEWQKNKGVHPKASKSKLKADRPDRSNYFNYKNDSGKIAVRGSPLIMIMIHDRSKKVHVLEVPEGCKTPTFEYDVMFVSQVVFSEITHELFVDQAVTIRLHCRIQI